MSKNSSIKYYQNNKEKPQKKAHERHLSFSQEEKEKSDNMIVKNAKICYKIKKQKLVEYRKECYKMSKNVFL